MRKSCILVKQQKVNSSLIISFHPFHQSIFQAVWYPYRGVARQAEVKFCSQSPATYTAIVFGVPFACFDYRPLCRLLECASGPGLESVSDLNRAVPMGLQANGVFLILPV